MGEAGGLASGTASRWLCGERRRRACSPRAPASASSRPCASPSGLTQPVFATAPAGDYGRLFIVELHRRPDQDPRPRDRPDRSDALPHRSTTRDRPGAGTARPRLPSRLREQRPVLRGLRRRHRDDARRALPGLGQRRRRGPHADAAARDRAAAAEPQRRLARLRARRLPLRRDRRRRRRQRQRTGPHRPGSATRRTSPTTCSARSCASTSTTRRTVSTTASRRATRSSASKATTRSGPTACAIPGGRASTARPATSGSPTSARIVKEELNFQPADSPGGENYGWRLREGTIATPTPLRPARPSAARSRPARSIRSTSTSTRPRCRSASITGGYVYRGPIAELQGKYFFADFSSANTDLVAHASTARTRASSTAPTSSTSRTGRSCSHPTWARSRSSLRSPRTRPAIST